jgi:hypothetical protein
MPLPPPAMHHARLGRRRAMAEAAALVAAAAMAGATAQAQVAGAGAAPRTPALAPPPELAAEWPQQPPRLHGAARLRWFGLEVYDIRLWTPEAALSAPERAPLALELQYARALQGEAIAERSLQEMARVGELDAQQRERWLAALRRLLPDVQRGDRLSGVHRPGWGARFFHNGQLRGELADAQFARLFFGIWLSPRTSEPGLRRQLLGESAGAGS